MANLITILRSLSVFIVVILLFWQKDSNIIYFVSLVLTILIISMDGLDGYVARKYNTTSKFGAVLDIIGDRIVENVYWITFLALGWLPVWIPLVVITRGIVVDGIRSLALEKGMTAFGKTTMMKSPLGKFLVASNFSRGTYAAFKGIAFSFLIIANFPGWEAGILKVAVDFITYTSVYITLFFCIVRGIPVIIEGKKLFEEAPGTETDKSMPNNINSMTQEAKV